MDINLTWQYKLFYMKRIWLTGLAASLMKTKENNTAFTRFLNLKQDIVSKPGKGYAVSFSEIKAAFCPETDNPSDEQFEQFCRSNQIFFAKDEAGQRYWLAVVSFALYPPEIL